MNIASYYYNRNLATHGRKMEPVLNIKIVPDRLAKAVVADYERGATSQIMQYRGNRRRALEAGITTGRSTTKRESTAATWHPRDAVHWLIDTVSKNGTFILDIPGKPDGKLDSKEIAVLDGITAWMQANSEAIYETRPGRSTARGRTRWARRHSRARA